MRTLIHYSPKKKTDSFEGTRLRKNLKGAMELSGINWLDSFFGSPDICHLIYPDEASCKEAVDEEVPLVVSALYSEDDKIAAFLKINAKTPTFLSKAGKIIDKADLVLVPSELEKAMVLSEYPDKWVEVLSPGVNEIRYLVDDEDEQTANLFYRYVRLPSGSPYFIGVGNSKDETKMESLKLLASKNPSCRFYYICGDQGEDRKRLNKLSRKYPGNLTLLPLLGDDIYRSAISKAKAYLEFGDGRFSATTILEAMASQTPIIAVNGLDGRSFLYNSKAFAQLNKDWNMSQIEPKALEKAIIEGRKFARANTIEKIGTKLKELYQEVLDKKGKNHD